MKIPPKSSVAYRVGEAIYKRGAMTEKELRLEVDVGNRSSNFGSKMTDAVNAGWLIDYVGKLALSDAATKYFDGGASQATKDAYVGQVAAPRQVNHMASPPLRKAFMPSSMGPRGNTGRIS